MPLQSRGNGGSIRQRIRSHLEFDKNSRTSKFVRNLKRHEFSSFKKHNSHLISSIAAIVYLQALMIYYRRKMEKRTSLWKAVMEGGKDTEELREEDENEESGDSSPSSPGENAENSPSHSLTSSNDATINGEADQSSSKHTSPRESVVEQPSGSVVSPILLNTPENNVNENHQGKVQKRGNVTFKAPDPHRRSTYIGRMFGDTDGSIDNLRPPFTRDPEGINLYLRLGTVLFGFGVMIMDVFRIADKFRAINSDSNCHSILWIPMNSIHAIYIFMQTYFLFKYHRITFNVQKFFIRFIMCHMAVSNLGQWMSTVVEEVITSEEELEYKVLLNATSEPESHGLHTPLHNDTSHHCQSPAVLFVHYLIPCGIEYSLIAGAIFYKMFQRIGHVGERRRHFSKDHHELTTKEKSYLHFQRVVGLTSDDPTECHRAHKGLFLGLLLFLTTLVAMALFYVFRHNKKHETAVYLYHINNIILITVGIIGVILALIRIKDLALRELSEEDAFDDNLLLIGLLATLFYCVFSLVPAISSVHQGGGFFVAKAILEMTQALLQVFLILEASRRSTATVEQSLTKPGRSMITFLLIINLSMWVIYTFALKPAENSDIFKAYYSGLAWKIISNLSLPLIIFFRFHSTVCFADIWTNAYRMHEAANTMENIALLLCQCFHSHVTWKAHLMKLQLQPTGCSQSPLAQVGGTFWGSRVVANPNGRAEKIEFPLKGMEEIVMVESGNKKKIDVTNEKECKLLDGRRIGAPCEISEDKTVVSVDDVTRQYALIVGKINKPFAGVYFAPMCQFWKPQQDELDYGYSFPFFILAKNSQNVTLRFAVGGTTGQEYMTLYRNHISMGEWRGTDPEEDSQIKTPLKVDTDHNRRTIEITIKKENLAKESFYWYSDKGALVVNVDWDQEGESPDYVTCRSMFH
ncbi:unnamed protein product [Rodentolepis nana]|uniref:DUF5727 domain-containing protein n=1 Tax=Rodentolepis nana TaxID=102285 RepID=A0A158QHX6_RODNA|nr:unnamed protein product [Rodentolepis nana]